ncbi:MAG: hypothetical protein JWN93_3693 [Hyphomicrobiales bacterium]|nr:hypothetical protein [Hyphomicrobiales bacterium]
MTQPSSTSISATPAAPSACGVPRCSQPALVSEDGLHGFCRMHLGVAAPAARERLAVTARRLAALQAIWDDPQAYEAVVASDRFLKLSHATCVATEMFDSARERLMLSILQSEANGGGGASLKPAPTRSIA